jgi:cysteine desulfurase/selenocysteine lyase
MNLNSIRKDFPILTRDIKGKPLIYFDNAATTQKPLKVINALRSYYSEFNAAIHRGVHLLSNEATKAYEDVRVKICSFIGAKYGEEIIFVRGTTEAINLVAATFGRVNVKANDKVLITNMEHHSNILPWQVLCNEKNSKLLVTAIDDKGDIDLQDYEKKLKERPKIVAIAHVSNVLGTINPIKTMVKMAHEAGAFVLVDGAQAAPHVSIDVADLDCDFYAFSGHKIYAPLGIGVLYGKKEHLEKMPPYQVGGGMIRRVTFEHSDYAEIPAKFEAGTQNVEGVIGLAAAIDYLNEIGMENVIQHEKELLKYAKNKLASVPELKFIGNSKTQIGVISFVLDKIHPHDVGTILDSEGIAVRAGHHCAMPLMERFQIPATTRVSFGIYNTKDEIDILLKGLEKVKKVFA